MAEAVNKRFSHEAFRAVLRQSHFHGCPDGFDEWSATFVTGAVALRRTCSARAQVFFHSVEFADEVEDPCGTGIGGGFDCLDEVPAYVGEAGDEAYARIGFGVGLVNPVAVALDAALKIFRLWFDKPVAAAPIPQ